MHFNKPERVKTQETTSPRKPRGVAQFNTIKLQKRKERKGELVTAKVAVFGKRSDRPIWLAVNAGKAARSQS